MARCQEDRLVFLAYSRWTIAFGRAARASMPLKTKSRVDTSSDFMGCEIRRRLYGANCPAHAASASASRALVCWQHAALMLDEQFGALDQQERAF